MPDNGDIARLRRLAKDLPEDVALITLLLDHVPSAVMVIGMDRVIRFANKAARDCGAVVGEPCWSSFGEGKFLSQEHAEFLAIHGKPHPETQCDFCLANELDCASPEPQRAPHVRAWDKVWDTYWIPLPGDLFLHYAYDITDICGGIE